MAAKLDARRNQHSWRKFTSNSCYLGTPSISQNVIRAHAGCQTQLQIGKRFGSSPRPHRGDQRRRASPLLICGRCSVSNHPGHRTTSFVIALSCKWWHTACISRYQWWSTPHHLSVESGEMKDPLFLNYLVVLNDGKGHSGVPTKASIKNAHTVIVSSKGPNRDYGFKLPSANPIKTNILVSILRSHTTYSWTRGKQILQGKGMPMWWQKWAPFQI